MAFACKKCKKAFRKDMSNYEESDEYCPHCDNHYVRVRWVRWGCTKRLAGHRGKDATGRGRRRGRRCACRCTVSLVHLSGPCADSIAGCSGTSETPHGASFAETTCWAERLSFFGYVSFRDVTSLNGTHFLLFCVTDSADPSGWSPFITLSVSILFSHRLSPWPSNLSTPEPTTLSTTTLLLVTAISPPMPRTGFGLYSPSCSFPGSWSWGGRLRFAPSLLDCIFLNLFPTGSQAHSDFPLHPLYRTLGSIRCLLCHGV